VGANGPAMRMVRAMRMARAMRRRWVPLLASLAVGLVACGAPRAVVPPAPGVQRPAPPPTATPSPARAASPRPAEPVADPGRAIPILMYHVVGVPPPHAPLAGLYVAPDLFARQMAALRAAGYQAVTLRQAYDVWKGLAPSPRRPIVLSFDDGYVGQFTYARPVLASYGWPGVLNLQVGRLNVPGGLSADQVRQMIAAGWEVDDHTVTHPDLTRVPPARLREEVVGAARRIRQTFGVPVEFFCYPAGRYDPAVVKVVREAGFLGATTTWPGDAAPAADGWWTLDRVRVAAGESPEALLATLRSYARRPAAAPPAAFPPPRRR
jgi:peptidoglycan/xylan/chitin deacetylase (PgdA/CDA1 family)